MIEPLYMEHLLTSAMDNLLLFRYRQHRGRHLDRLHLSYGFDALEVKEAYRKTACSNRLSSSLSSY
jgi:hypothetical protein